MKSPRIPTRPAERSRLSTSGRVICAGVVLAAGLVYLNALTNPFVYDDYRLIVENRSLLDITNVRAILLQDATRPVVNVSYAIDRTLWGPTPIGFHVTNVLLHMLNVLLLLVLGWQVVGDRLRRAGPVLGDLRPLPVILIAGALFGVHPMMTEAVGYISGRSELLVATFFLLAFIAVRRWFAGEQPRWLILSLVCWAFALASKEIAVMFPLIVLAYDHWIWPGSDESRRRRWWRLHVPLLTVMLAAIAVRAVVFVAVEHRGIVDVQWQFGLLELDVIRRYLGLLLWPSGQAIFHRVGPIVSVTDPGALVSVAIITIVIVTAFLMRREVPLLTVGVLWFFLLLVPSSALVMLNRGEPMAEHRVYLASVGLFLGTGMLMARLWRRLGRSRRTLGLVARGALLVLLVSLAARTVVRNAVWSDPIMVWAEAASMAPGHWLPQVPLGQALHVAGRHDEAIGAYLTALRSMANQPDALAGLGTCLAEVGRLDDARGVFDQLRLVNPRSTVASNGLGTVALLAGKVDEARQRFAESLAIDPANTQARRGLAALEETVGGNPAEALRLCREVAAIAPGTPGIDECIARNQARVGGGR